MIKGDLTCMGPMEPTDAPVVQEWLNEIELRRLCWAECPLPTDLDGARRWIQEMNAGSQTRLLSIRRLAQGDLVGFFTLRKLSWVSRAMRFGSAIWPPDLWNQGIGTDARRAVLNYAFRQLGLRRIYGFFADFNIASRRSHEKLGAEVALRTREAVYIDGAFHDFYGYVYRRERFPGMESTGQEDDTPGPSGWRWAPEAIAASIERAYRDYYGWPGRNGGACPDWYLDKHVRRDAAGEMVLAVEPIKRSAEMLFYPRHPGRLSPELVLLGIRTAFDELNLHRLQVCVPSSAAPWLSDLEAAGFTHEGHLEGIVFAHGAYLDLVFLGMLRRELRHARG